MESRMEGQKNGAESRRGRQAGARRATTHHARSRPSGPKVLLVLAFLALGLSACDATTKTEELMLKWGALLNVQVATGHGNEFPDRLDEIPAELRGDLSQTDGWGNQLYYQRKRDDLFRLVSGGVDGILGNEDDVVMINNRFVEASGEYAKDPLKKK